MVNSQHTPVLLKDRYSDGIGRQSLQFFALGLSSFVAAGLLLWGLCALFGKAESSSALILPTAFGFSTLFLLSGSFALHRAVHFVRREKQKPFRESLFLALLCGTMFMGVQGYGLWSLFPAERTYDSVSRGVLPFVMCLAALHALHLLIAVLCVAFILTRAWWDRYDHEYFWGVRVCAWFWHALVIVWGAILVVCSIAL